MIFLLDKYYDQTNAPLFEQRVVMMCEELKINPDYLMAIMYLESKLRPWARNTKGTGVGLIQFHRNLAIRLGTSEDELENMDGISQLEIIRKHLWPFGGYIKGIGGTWAACYFQDAVGCEYSHQFRIPAKYNEINRLLSTYTNNKIRFHQVERALQSHFGRMGLKF